MAKTDNKKSFGQIIQELKSGIYYPIYFLMGQEPFFIDHISEYIEKNILQEDEKEMNLRVIYGSDEKIENIILDAKQYPFMASKRIIIVKEAQTLKQSIDKIEKYLDNPPASTILVFCYKNEKIDRRKKYTKKIEEKGVLYDSEPLYDNQIPDWIQSYCADKGIKIHHNAAQLLSDNIGNNLLRIATEIDKLKIVIRSINTDTITADIVERHVGISKEYNNFELTKALGQKNKVQVFKIVNHFAKSPKSFVFQITNTILFNYFMNLIHCRLISNKSQDNISRQLGINRFFVDEYINASKNYSGRKLVEIISLIREADANSKGFNGNNSLPEDILRDLCMKILS